LFIPAWVTKTTGEEKDKLAYPCEDWIIEIIRKEADRCNPYANWN
jgi:hypothetical protein